MPSTIKLEKAIGVTNSMVKLMMNVKIAEVIDIAKSNLKYLRELF
jgi:hypothetical protein